MSSFILTPERAAQAVRLVAPSLREAARAGTTPSEHFHVVVMDPTIRPWSGARFESAILYEESFGSPSDWAYPFDAIARGKAAASWSSSLAADEMQQLAPHLYEADHAKWAGSAVHRGLIVAGSGVQPWFDAAFAGCVAHFCVALCVAAMEEHVLPAPAHFFRDL